MAERLHFVGWLRVFLIALVVGHHAAEPYNAAGGEWREMLDDPARSDLLLYFFLLNRTFFMGFFFLIAGYFTAASYDRHGAWGFARSRLLRLGVPLAVVVIFGFGTIGYGIYGEGSGYLRWLWRDYLGRGLIRFQPDSDGGECQAGEVVGIGLVVSGGEAAEVFNPVEEPLHAIALPVNPGAEGEAVLADGARWDVRPSAALIGFCADRIGVVGAICDQRRALAEVGQQFSRNRRVPGLTWCQNQPHRTPEPVDQSVDLGAQAAARAAHSAPFSDGAPCW